MDKRKKIFLGCICSRAVWPRVGGLVCLALAVSAVIGCYTHSLQLKPRVSRSLDTMSAPYSRVFIRRVQGEIAGCAMVEAKVDPAFIGGWIWTAQFWLGGGWRAHLRLVVDRKDTPQSYQSTLRHEVGTRVIWGTIHDGYIEAHERGILGTRTSSMAWGASSRLDPGHPLLWRSVINGQVDSGFRVVRANVLSSRGILVDRFHMSGSTKDKWGQRLRVDTSIGPVALWLDASGHIARIRRQVSGRGSPIEDWRMVTGPEQKKYCRKVLTIKKVSAVNTDPKKTRISLR